MGDGEAASMTSDRLGGGTADRVAEPVCARLRAPQRKHAYAARTVSTYAVRR